MTKVKGFALALMMILCLSTGVLGESPEEAWLAMPVSGTGGEATSAPKSGNEDPARSSSVPRGLHPGRDAKAGDNRFAQYARKNGYAYFFPTWRRSSPGTTDHRQPGGALTTAPIGGGPAAPSISAAFRSTPDPGLGNVDAATVANNHRMDFGPPGLETPSNTWKRRESRPSA